MSRSVPFGFEATERASSLAPAVSVDWSARYLGRKVLSASGSGDDGLATSASALAVLSGTLHQFKSEGAAVRYQKRNATTLAVTSAWVALAAGLPVADRAVGLTLAGSTLFALYARAVTTVAFRSSSDGGATWAAAVDVHTVALGNTVGAIMTSPNGIVALEERQAGGSALVYCYQWTGAAWSLFHSFDSGGTQVLGGGIDDEGGLWLVYAVDVVVATTVGTVTLRETKVYDLDTLGGLGLLHRGSAGGVRWREPKPVYVNGTHYLLITATIPRGSGDSSDRVALLPWKQAAVGDFHPLGPPRVVYAVEDSEAPAVAFGSSALFVMAGSFVQRLVEGTSSGTASTSAMELGYEPESERLDAAGSGSLDASALQVRCRLGLGASLIDMGIFWVGSRISSSRGSHGVGSWELAAYGLWGVLRRELQQQSAELLQPSGDPMTPGQVLQLILSGLGFTYSEAGGLGSILHPATAAERLTWTMRYGQPYAALVRSVLRWVGCELVPGVAVDGVTPTARVMQPGSRLGAAPAAIVDLGAAGDHPLLELASADPEMVTDVTVFPGGWDHQLALAEPVDRQLVLDASGAYGITSTIAPATRALARALAGAPAGMARIRPALEIELWDTVTLTDTAAGLSAARRLVRGVSVAAGDGRWEMDLALGLE